MQEELNYSSIYACLFQVLLSYFASLLLFYIDWVPISQSQESAMYHINYASQNMSSFFLHYTTFTQRGVAKPVVFALS